MWLYKKQIKTIPKQGSVTTNRTELYKNVKKKKENRQLNNKYSSVLEFLHFLN